MDFCLDIYGKRAFRNFFRKARQPLILLDKTLGHLFCHSDMAEKGRLELPRRLPDLRP